MNKILFNVFSHFVVDEKIQNFEALTCVPLLYWRHAKINWMLALCLITCSFWIPIPAFGMLYNMYEFDVLPYDKYIQEWAALPQYC